MSKSEKNADAESAPSFEEALGELEEIVRLLEDGTLGLEESMRQFEKGIALLRNCYQILEQADQKIQILTGLDESGNPLTAPFDAAATFEKSTKSAGRRKKKGADKKQSDEQAKSAPNDQPADDDAPDTLF